MNNEVIPANESEELKGLLDLGKQALVTFAEQGEAQSKLATQQLQFAEKRLEAEKVAFKFKFTAVIIFIVSLFGIIFGLIFAKNNIEAGLLILSHIVALMSGAFAGWGWQKGQNQREMHSTRCFTLAALDSGSYAASARAHGVRRHMKRDWEIYEDAARVAVSNVLRDIGVTSVDEKCKVKGQSATEWEIDARAWLNGSERFLLVEARRHCTSGLRQEEVAAIAFRVQDIGACGAIVVSPLPLQEGAKLVASHAHIEHLRLSANSSPEIYLAEYMGHRYNGIGITECLSANATLISGYLGPVRDA